MIKKNINLTFFCFENGDRINKSVDKQAIGIWKINKGFAKLIRKKPLKANRKDIIIFLFFKSNISLCIGSPNTVPINKCIFDSIDEIKIIEKTCRYIFKFLCLVFRINDKGIKKI